MPGERSPRTHCRAGLGASRVAGCQARLGLGIVPDLERGI